MANERNHKSCTLRNIIQEYMEKEQTTPANERNDMEHEHLDPDIKQKPNCSSNPCDINRSEQTKNFK